MGSVYYYQLQLNDSKFIREKMNAFKRKMSELDYTIEPSFDCLGQTKELDIYKMRKKR
jgi:hypothetical protein